MWFSFNIKLFWFILICRHFFDQIFVFFPGFLNFFISWLWIIILFTVFHHLCHLFFKTFHSQFGFFFFFFHLNYLISQVLFLLVIFIGFDLFLLLFSCFIDWNFVMLPFFFAFYRCLSSCRHTFRISSDLFYDIFANFW